MLKARRTVAAALVLGVGALTLTGCFATPPALPTAPSTPPVTQTPTEPSATPEPSTATEPSASAEPSPTASDAPATPGDDQSFTVDDGLGDTWTFNVVQLVADPPLQSGAAADGTFVIGVILDGQHDAGNTAFTSCFDILVEGSDGETYDYSDTVTSLTPENDIYFAGEEASFTDAVAAVQLPEGVEPVRVTMRSSFGYPVVDDVIIDITP